MEDLNSLKKGGYGPVLMIDRTVYETLGGHERVKGEILEHYAFCDSAREQGFSIQAFLGKGSVHYRMYPEGFKSLVQGWSKSFALGAAKTQWQILVLIILWIAGSVTIATSVAGIYSETLRSQIVLAIFYLAYAATIGLKLSRTGRFQIWTSLVFPVPLLMFLVIFIYSGVQSFGKRRVEWKGRQLTVETKEENK